MDRVRRYPSDLTDAEWEIVEPMLPSPQWMGRPEKHPRRAVVDGILYVVRTGCAWRYLPIDFPPWQTVYSHFKRLNRRGVTERILTESREQVRLAHGRQPRCGYGPPIPAARGVRHMIAALDLATGRLHYRMRDRKGWREFLGSWLNWIEAEFAVVRYFALNGTDHRSHTERDAAIAPTGGPGRLPRN